MIDRTVNEIAGDAQRMQLRRKLLLDGATLTGLDARIKMRRDNPDLSQWVVVGVDVLEDLVAAARVVASR